MITASTLSEKQKANDQNSNHMYITCSGKQWFCCYPLQNYNVTLLIRKKSKKNKKLYSLIFHMFSNKVHDNWSCEVSWVFLKKAEVALLGKIVKCLAGLRCCAVDVWWECVNKCIVNPFPPFSFFSEMNCVLLILIKIASFFDYPVIIIIIIHFPLGQFFFVSLQLIWKIPVQFHTFLPICWPFRTSSSSELSVTCWH